MYKVPLKSIWTYGLQLWGSASMFNTNRIQAFQIMWRLSNAPPYMYVFDLTAHNDLTMKTEHEEARVFHKRFHSRLEIRPNPIVEDLFAPLHSQKILAADQKEACVVTFCKTKFKKKNQLLTICNLNVIYLKHL